MCETWLKRLAHIYLEDGWQSFSPDARGGVTHFKVSLGAMSQEYYHNSNAFALPWTFLDTLVPHFDGDINDILNEGSVTVSLTILSLNNRIVTYYSDNPPTTMLRSEYSNHRGEYTLMLTFTKEPHKIEFLLSVNPDTLPGNIIDNYNMTARKIVNITKSVFGRSEIDIISR
jgi:hypothetical protein